MAGGAVQHIEVVNIDRRDIGHTTMVGHHHGIKHGGSSSTIIRMLCGMGLGYKQYVIIITLGLGCPSVQSVQR